MKKLLSRFIIIAALIFSMTQNVLAQDIENNELTNRLLENSLQKINTNTSDINFDFSDMAQKAAEGEIDVSLSSVLNKLLDLFFSEFSANLSALIKIVVIAVLSGVLCNLQGAFNAEGVASVSFLACFIVIAGLAVSVLAEIIQITRDTIDSLNLFMQGLIPSIAGIVAVSGTTMGASMSPSLFLCMQVITYLSNNLFLPMILLITSLSVINNMTGRFHITKLIEFARQTLKWSSGILLTVFIGLLGLQGFSFAFAGGVAGKAVKYAICNFIPIVGNVLSDSVEAVCASAVVVKNAVGIAGVLALLSICIMPLIKLLALSVMYRFAAGIAEPVTDKRIVNLLSDLAGNITQTFVILLMVCVMFIISVAMLCALSNIPMMMR